MEKTGISREKILGDIHSRSKDDPSRFRVRLVMGCPWECGYCYLARIGLAGTVPKKYGLTGLELVAALLLNRYFIPGVKGFILDLTYYGELFAAPSLGKVYEDLATISRFLKNPLVIVTKSVPADDALRYVSRLASSSNLVVLFTVLSATPIPGVEKGPPTPEERAAAAAEMRRKGVPAALLVQPAGMGFTRPREVLSLAEKYDVPMASEPPLNLSHPIYLGSFCRAVTSLVGPCLPCNGMCGVCVNACHPTSVNEEDVGWALRSLLGFKGSFTVDDREIRIEGRVGRRRRKVKRVLESFYRRVLVEEI